MPKYFFILNLIFIVFGCSLSKISKEGKEGIDCEMEVLDEIFIDLTEELNIRHMEPIPPPPPPPIKNKNGEIIGYDTTAYTTLVKNT